MKNKLLFVQFSNSMFIRHDSCDLYWETFYKRWEEEGYYMGKETFELPKWIAEISYFSKEYEKELLYCKKSVNEVIDKVNSGNYSYVLMSLMNANQHFIEKIISICKTQKFIVGGYNDKYLNHLKNAYNNVIICNATKDCAYELGCDFKFGTDYSMFKCQRVIPRLTLSYGCYNKCKFCIVPHGKIITVPQEIIEQQIKSFEPLDFRLIYLDDKTFGQADNYKSLYDLSKLMDKSFNGFIVQTTSGMVNNKGKIFSEIGVNVVEIGLETYNDEILKKYNKPSSEKMIIKALESCKVNKLKMLPNIIIGLPEETEKTYVRTYDFVMKCLKNNEIIGINPAIYTDYNNEQNLGEIDFLEDEKTDLHRKWWNKFNNSAAEILKK